MRFKNKSMRTVHKDCKKCCFKDGIECMLAGFDDDGEGGCCNQWGDEQTVTDGYVSAKEYQHSKTNWKKMHPYQAKIELMQKIKAQILFEEIWG
jgi:hypothetical protein